MTAVKQIEASARTQVGKGAARAVRRQGQTPAVIYGAGEAPQAIALNANQTRLMIYGGHFLTTIFEINVGGKKTRVIPRDYQLDPVKDFPIHVDFLRVAAGQTIKVMVPVHVVDQEACPGLKSGGTLQIVEHNVEIDVAPENIPEALDVSVAGLGVGTSVHVNDIKLPAGVSLTTRENLTLVTILAPSVIEDAAVEGAAEGTEAAKA
ncbi:50S ribosomal protein L25/general stress protein Ctc [Bosea sp. 2KB_26]|uniref:50S ribosomal protein L25/general stress protein Ctc n=1 Tax=Bosea sp. 2KB_26 TaxID=3237475 RepID=UPI003F92B1C1